MNGNNDFEIIIIGGSYAGLSAGLALGRSSRKVLVLDSGKPCNRQTPHSHNFLTRDGQTPEEISTEARKQVAKYPSVQFYQGLAVEAKMHPAGFEISTDGGDHFLAGKIILATGIADLLPDIPGFSACWGISVIHCPYCHGYEIRNRKTGILANGDMGFNYARMISNWTGDLAIFTNGKSTFNKEQLEKFSAHQIPVMEKEIGGLEQEDGQVKKVFFKDGSSYPLEVLYTKPPFRQHSDLPVQLGCELTEHGYIKVDGFQKTSVPGVYACGDSSQMMRSVSMAVATGTMAGAMANKEWIEERF